MVQTRALRWLLASLLLLCSLGAGGEAVAQKVYLDASDQTSNVVGPPGSGLNEAQFALINANIASDILKAAGFTTKVFGGSYVDSTADANSWGADIFISIHTNAGGGHGTETLYLSDGGKTLAGAIQNGLLSKLPYQDRGLKYRDNLWVLNNTDMFACLTEALFHDCVAESGYQGHPPAEWQFLSSADGQAKIGAGIAAGVCSYFGKTCGAVQPQKGWLKGVVYEDPDLAKHLAGAKVQVQGGPSATYDGTNPFAFELEPGDYTLTATLDGYEPGSVTRTVTASAEVWGSIALKPVSTGKDASVPDVVSITEAGADADAGKPSAGAGWNNGGDDSGCSCRLQSHGAARGAMLLVVACVSLLLMRRK